MMGSYHEPSIENAGEGAIITKIVGRISTRVNG